MSEINIKLNSIEDAQRFVNLMAKFDCDITVESNEFIADAKSILGVLSLDLTKPIILKCSKNHESEIKRSVDEFLCYTLG